MMKINTPMLLISVSSKRSSNGVYFYNGLFAQLAINANYFGIEAQTLNGFRESFEFLHIHAASIAAPFKTDVIPLLDKLTEEARNTGSVNSVRNRNGLLEGHNTDYAGAKALLQEQWKPRIAPRVVVYGSGGVVPSIVAAVRAVSNDAQVLLYSRNNVRGKELCKQLNLTWFDIQKYKNIDLWINATPASATTPEEMAEHCKYASTVFDLVAIQQETLFECTVKLREQQFIRGFDFYRAQFIEQFKYYFDMQLDVTLFDAMVSRRINTN